LTVGGNYLESALKNFRDYKRLGERALEQLSDAELFAAPDQESNSVAIIVQHMAGNMRSRWTDFLTSDGEKPWRDRDSEFEARPGMTRADLMALWEEGWDVVFREVGALGEPDLERSVRIRGEVHTVVDAINRQLTHYAYHVGQIVVMARLARGSEWRNLSVPKGRSAQFNARFSDHKA
jgi:uncharacterized damage-inducible protein DinB